jgi:type IV secretion system protein VirB9
MSIKSIVGLLVCAALSSGAQAQSQSKRFLTLEDAAVAQAKKWQQTGVAKPIMSDDGRVMYPFGQYLPKLTCTLLRACDIQLEPGELLTDKPAAGDTARFLTSKKTSGSGERAITHVVVKPTDVGIETNLIIYTDRRVYQIQLVSATNEKDYVNSIGFYYPEDLAQEWDESAKIREKAQKVQEKVAAAQVPSSCMEGLDFAYSVEGGAAFKPLRVYNACGKVFIHMPDVVATSETPVLVSIGKDGQAEFLNWRPKSPTVYEVDKLFDKAMLVIGTDGDEQKVTITWTKNKKKSWFSWPTSEAN